MYKVGKKCFVIVACMCLGVMSMMGVWAQDAVYERRIQSEALSDAEFNRVKSLIINAEGFRGSNEKDIVYAMTVGDMDAINKKLKSSSKLHVNIHLIDKGDTTTQHFNRSAITQIQSGKNKGRIILQKGSNMWLHKPGTRNAIRISPAQRLIGGASFADVSSTNYAEHYDPVAISELTIQGIAAYKITLQKVEKGVAYERIDYYINKKNNRPIKSEFYSRSKRRLKSMYFRKYGNLRGKIMTQEWIIVDAINTNAVTYIWINDMRYESLPENTYSIEGIKNF